MTNDYQDHARVAFDAFGLMVHHVERMQALSQDPADRDALAHLVAPLGQLHTVLSNLHYKVHED